MQQGATGQRRLCFGSDAERQVTQVSVHCHDLAPAVLAIEQGTFGHILPGHLLQAKRLPAELHLVGAVGLGTPALVLDGVGDGPPHLHHVGHAMQTMRRAGNLHRAQHARTVSALGVPRIRPLVQQPPLRCQTVLFPQPLHMDQSGLTGAEQPVLKCGQRKALHLTKARPR